VLPENRTVDLGTFKLMFMNGNFYVGTTGITGGSFKMELVSTNGGLLISSQTTGLNVSANDGTGISVAGNNIGIQIGAPTNVIKTSGITPGSADPSSVFDVFSVAQGVRVFPPMSTVDRDGMSPTSRVMILNTDIEYPEIYQNTYGWQSIGYGEIRLRINFSDTPLNAGNSYTVSLLTNIPAGKIIHKIVGMGTTIDNPVGDGLFIGLQSDNEYFFADIATLNGDSGTVSVGNSKRTLASNEYLSIKHEGGATIDSGILDLLILHT
jgi:hypothetical protein